MVRRFCEDSNTVAKLSRAKRPYLPESGVIWWGHDASAPDLREELSYHRRVRWVDQEFTRHDFREGRPRRPANRAGGLHGMRFLGANLSESMHLSSAFRNCRFVRATLWQSTFRQCSLLGSTFEDCRLRPIVFEDVDFTRRTGRR